MGKKDTIDTGLSGKVISASVEVPRIIDNFLLLRSPTNNRASPSLDSMKRRHSLDALNDAKGLSQLSNQQLFEANYRECKEYYG